MATVTSYTADRILDLLSGLTVVEGQQEEFAALIAEIKTLVEQNDVSQAELRDLIPQLEQQVSTALSETGNLRDNVVPSLEQSTGYNAAAMTDLQDIVIPSLQSDIEGISEQASGVYKTFYSDVAPEEYDIETERYLVAGDTWYDTSDGDKEYVWTGTQWSIRTLEIADFSLTVDKFKSSTHMIY